MLVWLVISVALLVIVLYIRNNDAKLACTPQEALTFCPDRWTQEEIQGAADRLIAAGAPPSLLTDRLPPKTGRRYIVIGGGGFLGGWIVLHLLQRGEDPHSIRILDIHPPRRKDLLDGKAKDVEFIQVDISCTDAVLSAFRKPWPTSESGSPEPKVTVFHTAAIIRFYERDPRLLAFSENINVKGTQNIIDAARQTGVSTLVFTSSGSIGVRRSRFWLWPWQKEPDYFVQIINDEDDALPKRHEHFFSNYAISKSNAERIVRAANKTPSGSNGDVLRTGTLRPGNGIYGAGGDLMIGLYLRQKRNPTWIREIVHNFVFVENVSLAHLCYEQRLIELENGSANPDIGGQAYCVTDAGPPRKYGDIYAALSLLTNGETHFINLSPTSMLALAHIVEAYHLARYVILKSRLSTLGKLFPPINGDLVSLQPSMFALVNVHLIFDDSRARLSPEKGGLGYLPEVTTLDGVCQVVLQYKLGGEVQRAVVQHAESERGFGLARAEVGVEEMIKNVGSGV